MKNPGEQFIHQKNPELHKSEPVEHEQKRKKKLGESMKQKPAEKLEDWFKVLEQTHTGHRDDPRVLERIKNYYHKEHVIKEDEIPESYFKLQQRIAREQGHGDIAITDQMREQLSEVIIADQESTLDQWVDYFTSPDSDSFPMWSKYWAFNGMLKLGPYDKEKHKFSKRAKDTTAPFADLNREALAYVVDMVIKKANKEDIPEAANNPEFKQLLEGANFGKLYAHAIEQVTPAEQSELENVAGEWVKYEQGSDHMPLVESLQGHGTGWCTAGEYTAQAQLEGGDFYVYYSYDKEGNATIPRVAIRMEDERIAEVRGVAEEQNLDPYIGEVVEKQLNKHGSEGERYKKSAQDMRLLTEIDTKLKKGAELSKEDLRFLYELDSPIEGFGYDEDPRIEEILSERAFILDMEAIFTTQNHKEIAEKLIEAGWGAAVARNLKMFEGLDHLQIAEKLIEAGQGSVVAENLNSFEGLNSTVAEKLIFWNGGNVVAKNLNLFEGLSDKRRAEILKKYGR